MSDHALLSPSGAHRWLECTPSARLEAGLTDAGSKYASEGTVAHSLGELLIKQMTGQVTKKEFAAELKVIKSHTYKENGEVVPYYNMTMHEHSEDYATFVVKKWSEAQVTTPDAQLFLETKLDLTKWVRESFGTGDAAVIAEPVLTIADLKYGKGVKVDAEDNEQLMLYALGWLDKFESFYSIETVTMIIYQPRLDAAPSEWSISVKDLKAWAENYLKPRAELAWNGEGEFNPGDACQWCKAKYSCRALADYMLDIAKEEFTEADKLADEDFVEILKKSGQFIKWMNGMVEYALKQALNGKKWPGMKIVQGLSKRMYKDTDPIIKELFEMGFEENEIFNPKKLKGITDVTKLVGAKKFDKDFSPYVIKPDGKPVLVVESDKRVELNSLAKALEDFEDELPEDE